MPYNCRHHRHSCVHDVVIQSAAAALAATLSQQHQLGKVKHLIQIRSLNATLARLCVNISYVNTKIQFRV